MSSATKLEGIVTDKQVVVHPLVLLSVVDHYNRVAQGSNKRVVGTLLGEYQQGSIHVTNAFAIPFEEDIRDPTIWFLDHNYHESMYAMFRKVNVKENVVGWYSTGPKIKPADLEIHEVFRRYCAQPVYVIVDVKPKGQTIPTDAYLSLEEPSSNKLFRRTFVHIPSAIEAFEAEEVGVEHLLRDIKNASTLTLGTRVQQKMISLHALVGKLQEMAEYLRDVLAGKLPANPKILYNFQDIFNLLPDLDEDQLRQAFALETNDMKLAMYIGSVVRSVIAMHDLISNKVDNKQRLEAEEEKQRKAAEEKEKKEKEEKEKEDKEKDENKVEDGKAEEKKGKEGAAGAK
uniref:MPN domain-containing protein n=1 Tax=Chromera velia CCMP2878 TaxID=1169474 RepID=A0A0G4F2P0_9ALVE|mmetsp:Transcript_9076/g.17787  ORF Transcript_9076/g.17787 Transcript_9076/m.17787 type:complete len:344 (-) Transcript_9076:566-1597(-)|eukprot:Cvel_14684.t1-p1 / transcript=Cvel_14684.t1 / gene=Cvel_14684 / organism=Chromera_velia_CCMP2878 / gene_product=Probable 26S proteasome non-ATPase regulatory, putative / transcript_product=Probable 26S proteasome non-ATPase regulatory, putative / location=Cvel_scaffold1053:46299-51563(-) / protein_length=343 / sequence_SO=supercontig / SO=protein_coding / is_pseudo=false